MHKPITTVGLLFLIALASCEKREGISPSLVVLSPEADVSELRLLLEKSKAEMLQWKSKAEALAAAVADADDSNDPASEPAVLTMMQMEPLIVRGWAAHPLDEWRDVQLGDYEWSIEKNSVIGRGKTEPKWLVIVHDQYGKDIVLKYCKLAFDLDLLRIRNTK